MTAITTQSNVLSDRLRAALPSWLKGSVTALLVNRVTGHLIRKYACKTLHGAKYPFNLVDEITAARIYFKVWEMAEIRAALRYVEDDDSIIELGSSIGVLASTVCSRRSIKTYVAVEPNPDAIEILKEVLGGFDEDIRLVQKAINYSSERSASFLPRGFTASRLANEEDSMDTIEVATTTLRQLLVDNKHVEQPWVLIADIEGEEADLITQDMESLRQFRLLMFELEEGKMSIAEQVQALQGSGFVIQEQYGNVFVFRRSN